MLRLITALMISLLLLSGCFKDTPATQPTSAISPSSAPASNERTPLPSLSPLQTVSAGSSVAAATAAPTTNESVFIRLDSEPRLHSPITTWVSAKPQTYTIQFRENMNRASVEKALTAQLAAIDLKPSLQFNWKNDRELRLDIITASAQVKAGYPYKGYTLNVNGAKTAAGETMENAPSFHALLPKPNQLWRISTDGSQKEKLTLFEEPYMFSLLTGDPRYATAFRPTKYCECDATYPFLYAVYDIEEKKLTAYPVSLVTSYRGPGDFTVDMRGFFYERGNTEAPLPVSTTAHNIHLDDYIYGSGISRDGKLLFLAAGKKAEKKNEENDLDFIVIDLQTKAIKRLPKTLLGETPDNQVSDAKLPVTIIDDSTGVYATMIQRSPYQEIVYRYSQDTGKVEKWTPPDIVRGWPGFMTSSDGQYRYYWNGGLFHLDTPVAGSAQKQPSFWLPNTHSYIYNEYENEQSSSAYSRKILMKLDASTGESTTVTRLPGPYAEAIGTSSDGRWIYVSSDDDF